MAKKRLKKKQYKKHLQQQVASVRTEQKVRKYTQKELETIIAQQEQKRQREERKKAKAKQNRKNLISRRARKAEAIAKLGIDPYSITVKELDKIKLKDIENKNINRHSYPSIFGIGKFDFNTVYKLKDNERLYLAFRDFAGETSLEEIIAEFSRLSDGQLLDRLEQIVHTRPTHKRGGKGDSSGSAGDYRMNWGTQDVIKDFQYETYNKNRLKSIRKHGGSYKGYQVLKDGHRNSFSEVTPRGLLIFANAFCHNVTEFDRLTFYQEFYSNVCYHIPDMKQILPKPLDS